MRSALLMLCLDFCSTTNDRDSEGGWGGGGGHFWLQLGLPGSSSGDNYDVGTSCQRVLVTPDVEDVSVRAERSQPQDLAVGNVSDFTAG